MFLLGWYGYRSGPDLFLDPRFFSVTGVPAGILIGQTWIHGGSPKPCIVDALPSTAGNFP